MDFKTAKEIVLALKEIAKNIQSDKSSNNNDNSDNKDDLQYSLLIDPYSDSYGTMSGNIIFKDLVENSIIVNPTILGFKEIKDGKLTAYEPVSTLGEIENSEILIKYFNKTIDIINELFDKYDELEEFYSSTIILYITICNQLRERDYAHNAYFSNQTGIKETCCFISKSKEDNNVRLTFKNYYKEKYVYCDTTTKFDENSVIYNNEE